jgi:hypothetical protein
MNIGEMRVTMQDRLRGSTFRNSEENSISTNATGATSGYNAGLWQMASVLWSCMDAGDYKQVLLDLIIVQSLVAGSNGYLRLPSPEVPLNGVLQFILVIDKQCLVDIINAKVRLLSTNRIQ